MSNERKPKLSDLGNPVRIRSNPHNWTYEQLLALMRVNPDMTATQLVEQLDAGLMRD